MAVLRARRGRKGGRPRANATVGERTPLTEAPVSEMAQQSQVSEAPSSSNAGLGGMLSSAMSGPMTGQLVNSLGIGKNMSKMKDSYDAYQTDKVGGGAGMASAGLGMLSNGLDFGKSFLGGDSEASKGLGIASGGMNVLGGGLDMFSGIREFGKAKDTKGKLAAGGNLFGGLMRGASGLFDILGNAGVDPELMKKLGGGAGALGGLAGVFGKSLGGGDAGAPASVGGESRSPTATDEVLAGKEVPAGA